jgi:ribosome biogenesis GTPase / thiamine phosphate phosphatase
MPVPRGPAASYIAGVSAEKAAWTPRLVVSRPVGERTGRVVAVEVGVVQVVSRRRRLRASLGSALLQEMAKDATAAPRVGDRVQLRSWADGPVTVERVLARAVPPR